jgi:hypothetical protein
VSVVRPDSVWIAPGYCVATKRAEDGGRQFVDDAFAGIVLRVRDEDDEETGERRRVFDTLDWRSCGGDRDKRQLLIRTIDEAEVDLDKVGPASLRELRNMRRKVMRFVEQRSQRRTSGASPASDSVETEAMAAVIVLWHAEVAA